MVSEGAQKVLADIFDGTLAKGPVLFTEFADIAALADLFSRDAPEEALQSLLTERPQLLFGGFGYGETCTL